MENYLCIGNEKIALSPEFAEALKKEITKNTAQKTKLSEIAVGDTFKVGDYEFIVLEHNKSNSMTAQPKVRRKKFRLRHSNFR